MRNFIHRVDIYIRHARIEIGLRWIIVQMWFLKMIGIKYANKSYKEKTKKYVNDLIDLTKEY